MNEEIHNRDRRLFLVRLGMPAPNREMNDAFNRELEREREYYEREVYDTSMKAIDDGNGVLYFLDAPCGTDKTFFMSEVLATVRARSNIAVAVA
ncbi:hypothetical protein WA026_006021 [Henosepilachna vigintioctopunctata]|uniref:ATP-dependent DNA helicase n=1 Tax=Henosepilachna vigintioctopunctata TaxID=420089 RepID=A0AAW1TRZ3_9CUCU